MNRLTEYRWKFIDDNHAEKNQIGLEIDALGILVFIRDCTLSFLGGFFISGISPENPVEILQDLLKVREC